MVVVLRRAGRLQRMNTRLPASGPLSVLAACALSLLVAGCGDERSHGIVFTGDGRMAMNTATTARAETERVMTEELSAQMAPWSAQVTIRPDPVWVPDRFSDHDSGDWRWQGVSATIALVEGAGDGPDRATLQEAVVRHLQRRSVGSATVAVAIVRAQPAAGPVASAAQVVASTSANGQRTYVIQAGDTLADISTVFYGTPTHWRRIVEANPGLDPAALPVGSNLVIPAVKQ